MMKVAKFIAQLNKALKNPSLYVKGGFGQPATERNKNRAITSYSFNRNRAYKINSASEDTFFFDCVCLGKGILWGWDANPDMIYGGAIYCSNGVPDFLSNDIKKYCTSWVDNKKSNIQPIKGEWLLGLDGRHIGYYIGNNELIEATLYRDNSVDGVHKIPYYRQHWLGHGKLKFIDYGEAPKDEGKVIICPCCGAKFKEVK